jgi:cob(I)alamin adenosyltransferase
MFYTRKGDDGTTSFFDSKERTAKNSVRAEALGALDEINSLLGLCKIKTGKLQIKNESFEGGLEDLQQGLFIVQANVAGAPKNMPGKRIEKMEEIINTLEKEMPPVTTFFVSGGTELAALFDFARTIARRAERRVLAFTIIEQRKLSPECLQFLNRLSSLLYAFARYANFHAGIPEKKPHYNDI